MSIRLYEWEQGIAELGGVWRSLLQANRLNPSLHPDWMNISLTAHGLTSQAKLLLIESNSGDTAILPVLLRTVSVAGVPLRCMDLASNVLSYHAAMIASGGQQTIVDELLNSETMPPFDVLRMGNIVQGGPTDAALLAMKEHRKVLTYAGQHSPYVAMLKPWPDYLRTLSKKMRANITRCIRTTEQSGDAVMQWYEGECDTDRLLSDILEVEAKSWKASESKAIEQDAAEGRYHKALLPWLARHGLMANVLYVNQRPTAYVLCASWGGWIGQLKTSFDQTTRDAGFRVIQASIERAHTRGENEYDFLGDAAPHKLRWTERIRSHEDYWLFAARWRGRASFSLKRAIDAWRRKRAPKDSANVQAQED
jgi:hypothetical protein